MTHPAQPPNLSSLATTYSLSDELWEIRDAFRHALSVELEDLSGKLAEEDEEFGETQRGESVTAWKEDLEDLLEALDDVDKSPDEPDEQ